MKRRQIVPLAGIICSVSSMILFLTSHETLGQFFLGLAGLSMLIIGIMIIIYRKDWEEERRERN